jgi:DNA-binding SARP family transcriptional activator
MVEREVRFAVLGPVRAWCGESELDLGQAKARAILASLLLRRGSRASRAQLVDDLWGTDRPTSAEALIRTYVYRLRKGIGAQSSARIHTTSEGYELEFAAALLDLSVFERLAAEARVAREAGDPGAAATLFQRCLATWSGTALAGVPGPFAAAHRTRLDGLRLSVLEERLAAVVAAGHYADAASELAALIAEQPLRERLRELHMIALNGAGRRADALAAFEDANRKLRDELGVSPTHALRETHRRILTGELTLAAPPPLPLRSPPLPPPPETPTEPSPPRAPNVYPYTSPPRPEVQRPAFNVTPAQLPAHLPRFVGRTAPLALLTAPVPDGPDSASSAACVVHGMPGIGKTTLALQAAHLMKDRYPDGQLYVDLRGFDEVAALTPDEALRDFLGALGVPPGSIPASLNARSALYRSILAGRKMLLLLDNARDADQVQPLLPGSPDIMTLITSRNRLPGLTVSHGARSIHLDPYDQSEADAYLAWMLGADRVHAQRDAADAIIDYCAGLPLALAIVTARAAHLPDTSLAEISAPLRDARDNLDPLALGEDPAANARTVFDWSYQSLGPESARLFRLLSLHPGPDITPTAAAVLTTRPAQQVRSLLRGLAQVHLLREPAPDRFTSHDLLRTYADELSRIHDPEEERAQAVDRLLGYFVGSADAADRLITTGARRRIMPAARRVPTAAAEEFADERQALAWLAAEYPVLVAAVKWAADHRSAVEAWQLGWQLNALPVHLRADQ